MSRLALGPIIPALLLSACSLGKLGSFTTTTSSPSATPSSSPQSSTRAGHDMTDDRSTDGIGGSLDNAKPPGAPLAATGTCDVAHDHCLRPQTRFMYGGGGDTVTPIWEHAEHYYRWDGQSIHGQVYATRRVDPRALKRGEVVIFFAGKLPTGELEAQTALDRWTIIKVNYVDPEAGTAFAEGNIEIPLANARLVTNPEKFLL